jgi:hypothetical protein
MTISSSKDDLSFTMQPLGVQFHCATGSHFAMILTHTIAEDYKDPIVAGACRQPAQQPFATFWTGEFARQSIRVLFAVSPEMDIDQSHCVRAQGLAAAGLMWHEQDIGPHQCRGTRVLDDVVIIADQNAESDCL